MKKPKPAEILAWSLILAGPILLVVTMISPVNPTWNQIADHIVTYAFVAFFVWRFTERRNG